MKPVIGKPLVNFYFKLDGKNVVPATEEEFIEQFKNSERRIIKQDKVGPMLVSTVFLGLDHGFGGGRSLFFETMVFDGVGILDDFQTRYETYDEAEIGHAKTLARARRIWSKFKTYSGKKDLT